jgi:hypothetical protein
LYNQAEELDIRDDLKVKKKAKTAKVLRLTRLSLQGIIEELKPLKEVQFKAFNPRDP